MTNPAPIEAPLPKGVTDFLPEKADKIGYIEGKIRRVFELWGFRRIITPLLEFQDVMAAGLGEDLKERTFRFDDRQTGKLLAIPSDITPQVARIVATRMRGCPLPHRLYYIGRVLRHVELQSGRSRETFQAGVELIGLDSPEADAEMVAMAVEILKGLGFEEFKVDLGHTGFIRGVMAASGLGGDARRRLQEAVGKKDSSAVRAILETEPVADRIKEELAALPRLFGGREVLAEAARVATSDSSRRALDNIAQVLDILDIHGVSDHLTLDLGEIRGLDYHSGLTFEGFVTGIGEAVCSGGRYDNLTQRYGYPAPATGFAFNILALLNALEKRPDVEASKTRDLLIFNLKDDRREALEIAQHLRALGYSTARDIIHRDFNDSLDYARRMNILRMMVIGGDYCAADEAYVVRVADKRGTAVKKADLMRNDFSLNTLP
ncbi:regulatory subunit of short ATP phosphoribosyltransferase [Geobacter metallireducens GS-15]|uniref:ATP phosphoribosyltransferase regulatory subunit n=1 Tax=Geobacter metallireducens (strain ATCC 53774 / DSM 7210 / GS-15) TaxID=269799 RepID=HISZ_GEOMG|nr:ATP phosphoribosyltransferase regulatory subunit [Geobacter metallireducens]Q39QK2.1 RecName: Full=ATP phosphoribosyltransferase regulatory subunit [Geobacter metallireducens GS-15]ABB33472.1 regulatory subunit of short ATP phosphoribosyltransferase [Geobacter metallireducens GS-15]